MAVYSISYDLKAPGRNYDDLYEAIKSLGIWWHYLESNWLVSTELTATSIGQKLRSVIDRNDDLLVIRVTDDYDGWLPEEAWKWIRSFVNEKALAA